MFDQNIGIFILLILTGALTACGTPSGSGSHADTRQMSSYTVQKGDTLSRIARQFGRSNSDIITWNKLTAPNDIKVGQALRVAPPSVRAGTRVGGNGKKQSRDGSVDAAMPSTNEKDPVDWTWPAVGTSGNGVVPGKKGIDIFGRLGQPVIAAAAGKVMYAGSGIRGYGNLVIVKHNSNLLSVYAHNKTIVVKEGQMVDKGQKIAEMGKSDSNAVKLYFEIRRQGKPVDAARFLPGR